MLVDVWTVTWKEWRELIAQRRNLHEGAVSLLLILGVFGIVWPVGQGVHWLDSPLVMFLSGWVPFMLVTSAVADAFAGERERHTLETLLATRLPDRAILLGKICAVVSYGWGITLLILLLGWASVNVVHGGAGLLFYRGVIGWGSVALSLLGAALAAHLGVLVSLRAPTVRQAQQTLSLVAMVIPFLVVYGGRVLPDEIRMRLIEWATMTENVSILIVLSVLGLLNVGLLLLATIRFRRDRLILD